MALASQILGRPPVLPISTGSAPGSGRTSGTSRPNGQFKSPEMGVPRSALDDDVDQAEAGPSTFPGSLNSPRVLDGSGGNEPREQGSSMAGSASPRKSRRSPEYLQPSEFYPLNNAPNASSARMPDTGEGEGGPTWLSPEDDKLATRGIPIFRPTLEEFEDFEGYVTKTVPWGQYSGIIKIIPPQKWKETLPPIPPRALADVRIKNPIQQNMLGQTGLFRQSNVEKSRNKPLTIQEWFEKASQAKFAGPGPKDLDLTLDRDSEAAKKMRREAEAEVKRKKEEAREKRMSAAARKRAREEQREAEAAAAATEGQEDANGEDGSGMSSEVKNEMAPSPDGGSGIKPDIKEEIPAASQDSVPPLDPSSHSTHSSPDPLATTPRTDTEAEPVPRWYEDFQPDADWLPKETHAEDYTPEACANLERKFWKNIGLGEPSWYGADLQGTLFPDPKTPWNVAHLPNLLTRLGRELPGVNRPYLYFGMWRAAFAWHVEDMDLFSINYIHFGAPKFWYAIPQGHAEHFERTIGGYFPVEAKECDQFLRHKSYVMSPTRLAKDGVRVNMLVHNQGEFVITFPRGYHAGFNMGFNCAESVNFALDSWVDLGRRAKVCQCVSHSVRIDMDELLGEQEKRMKTERELIDAFEQERMGDSESTSTPAKRSRKRARPSIVDGTETLDPETNLPVSGLKTKKSVVPLQKKPRTSIVKAPTVFPCILCPGMDESDLIPVWEPSDHIRNSCKSKDGVVRAHGVCVNSTPEVWVEDREVEGGQKAFVMGVDGIQKDRWNLKCQSCKDKKLAAMGTKVQCVNGKCPKAFHVSCARDDDQVVYRVWEVEETEILPLPEDAPPDAVPPTFQKKSLKTEILCPNHNPDVKEAKKRAQAEALKAKVLAFIPGQSVKVRAGGGLFEVKFIRASEGDRTATVQHQSGEMRSVKWTDFDFRPGPVPLAENEYARHHTHTRRPSGLPTSDTVTTTTSPAFASTAQHQAQHQPQPQPQNHNLVNGSSTSSLPQQSGQLFSRTALPSYPPPPSNPSTSSASASAARQLSMPNPGTGPRPSGHHQALSVQSMLNRPINHYDPRQIPSRVVVCNSADQPPYHAAASPSTYPALQYAPVSQSRPGPAVPGSAPYYGSPASSSLYTPFHPSMSQQYSRQQYPLPQYPTPMPNQQYPYLGYQAQQQPPVHRRPSHGTSNGHPHVPHHHASASSVFAFAPPPLPVRQYSTSQTPVGQSQGAISSGATSTQRTQSGSQQTSPAIARPSQPAQDGSSSGRIDLGLQRMRRLMDNLPPNRTPAIHLAGTNGKGSVSIMLEACLRAAGLSVARYNSPHLIESRRAIALNGAPPSQAMFADAVHRVNGVNNQVQIGATSFELATAVAYTVIGQFNPDVMIIECGMGGETDATNVIPPQLILASGLTAVGLDHTEFLGDTVEKIAEVKARIAVPEGMLVVAPQRFSEVQPVVQRVAQEKQARLVTAIRSERMDISKRIPISLNDFTRPPATPIRTVLPNSKEGGGFVADLSLAGNHQLENASLALTILDSIRSDPRALEIQPKLKSLSDSALRTGLAHAEWAGRCSWLQIPIPIQSQGHRLGQKPTPILVDGAHNGDSAKTLRDYVDSLDVRPILPGSDNTTWIISVSDSKGKSPSSILTPLLKKGDNVILTQFSTPVDGMPWIKPVDPNVLSAPAQQLVCGATVTPNSESEQGEGSAGKVRVVDGGITEALREAGTLGGRGLTVVCGSLYLVSDIYRLLERS